MPASDASVREPSLLQLKDFEPDTSGGLRRWVTRGQNFRVDWVEALRAGAGTDIESAFETLLLLPDVPATISQGATRIDAGARSVCILPPGRWTVQPKPGGACVVLASLAPGQTCGAINEAAYREPDPRIVPMGRPYVPRECGDHVRVMSIDRVQAPKDKPRLKMLQSATLSINWVEYEGVRDRTALSPHSHTNFEQGSLAIAGDFVHHLRVEWGANADLWQDDRHARLGSPSLMVVPVRLVHTSEGAGAGRHLLIDIFSPPRSDFIAKGWVANAADYAAPAGGD